MNKEQDWKRLIPCETNLLAEQSNFKFTLSTGSLSAPSICWPGNKHNVCEQIVWNLGFFSFVYSKSTKWATQTHLASKRIRQREHDWGVYKFWIPHNLTSMAGIRHDYFKHCQLVFCFLNGRENTPVCFILSVSFWLESCTLPDFSSCSPVRWMAAGGSLLPPLPPMEMVAPGPSLAPTIGCSFCSAPVRTLANSSKSFPIRVSKLKLWPPIWFTMFWMNLSSEERRVNENSQSQT